MLLLIELCIDTINRTIADTINRTMLFSSQYKDLELSITQQTKDWVSQKRDEKFEERNLHLQHVRNRYEQNNEMYGWIDRWIDR